MIFLINLLKALIVGPTIYIMDKIITKICIPMYSMYSDTWSHYTNAWSHYKNAWSHCTNAWSHYKNAKDAAILKLHYENMPMQNTEIFKVVKNENFHQKNFDIFLIFAQNIDCGYTLEPPRRGGSNEYPQYMFWNKNKKNRYIPANPSFSI